MGLQHRNYIISKPIKEQAFSEGDVWLDGFPVLFIKNIFPSLSANAKILKVRYFRHVNFCGKARKFRIVVNLVVIRDQTFLQNKRSDRKRW